MTPTRGFARVGRATRLGCAPLSRVVGDGSDQRRPSLDRPAEGRLLFFFGWLHPGGILAFDHLYRIYTKEKASSMSFVTRIYLASESSA